MSDNENIQDKLVPYVEGVLADADQREVAEALRADPELSREASRLKDTIMGLRKAFAAGVKPSYEPRLSPEEVQAMALAPDELDQATRKRLALALAESDEAQAEFDLLRELEEELGRKVEVGDVSPEMPVALAREFSKLYADGQPEPARHGVSVWQRLMLVLGNLNPKPFVAGATAMVLLCCGVYFVQFQPGKQPTVAAVDAPGADSLAPGSPSPSGLIREEADRDGETAFGVMISDTDDPGKLREQARTLLDNQVRYTVKGNALYVSEKELEKAQKALGQELEAPKEKKTLKTEVAGEIAMVEEEQELTGKTERGDKQSAEISSAPEGTIDQDGFERIVVDPKKLKVAEAANKPAASPARSSSAESASGRQKKADERIAEAPVAVYRPKDEPSEQPPVKDAETPRPSAARPEAVAAQPSAPEPAPVVVPPAPRPMAQPALEKAAAAKQSSAGSDDGKAGWSNTEAGQRSQSVAQQNERKNRLRAIRVGGAGTGVQAAKQPVSRVAGASVPSSAAKLEAGGAKATQAAESSAAEKRRAQDQLAANYADATDEEEEADAALEAELARDAQNVASRFSAVASVEFRDGSFAVIVRASRKLSDDEMEELRKTLRSELSLKATDTIIIRQP